MSEGLDLWLAYQRRYYGDLIQHDDGLPDHFDDLARRSEPHVLSMPWRPYWSPDSAFTPKRGLDYGLPSGLLDEWISYRQRWIQFYGRNPRIALAELMSEISEADDSTSFPVGWEHAIEAWVRSGFTIERPFYASDNIDTPNFRRLLMATARAAGDGWVFYDPGEDRLVWRTA